MPDQQGCGGGDLDANDCHSVLSVAPNFSGRAVYLIQRDDCMTRISHCHNTAPPVRMLGHELMPCAGNRSCLVSGRRLTIDEKEVHLVLFTVPTTKAISSSSIRIYAR